MASDFLGAFEEDYVLLKLSLLKALNYYIEDEILEVWNTSKIFRYCDYSTVPGNNNFCLYTVNDL